MKNIFYFGEKVEGYDIRVLNERELRAGAGILFVFAMIAFFNALLLNNYGIIKIFVVAFAIDFAIRIFVNPKYSPSLILGRMAITKQKPEYVGASQKKFAWALGFVLAVIMFFLVVVSNIVGPINFSICLICLTLLFFEATFGICVGCKIYNLFNKEKAQLCPGGVCEVTKKDQIQKIEPAQALVVIIFIGLIISIAAFGIIKPYDYIQRDKSKNIEKIK